VFSVLFQTNAAPMLKRLRRTREKILVWLTHKIALPVLLVIRKPKEFPYTLGELHQMPEGSLGRELAIFLANNKLHLLRYYEKHDIKHVIMDYPSTEKGEVCLQFFMLGNGHVSFPVLITVSFGTLFMPEYYKAFAAAFTRGKRSNSLNGLDWFTLVPLPLAVIRKNYNII
jgi:ubiquinone biosynthesis protein Coq4